MKKRNNIMKKMLSLLTVTMLMVSGMNLQVFANDSKGGGGGYKKHEVELTKTFDGKNPVSWKVDGKTVSAEFTLYKKGTKPNNNVRIANKVTDQNGKIKIKDLSNGEYYFVEKSVTLGYLKAKDTYFTINNGNATVTIDNKSDKADMTFTKTATPGTYSKVGDVITYTFTVTNTGTKELKNVRVTDNNLEPKDLSLSPNNIKPGEIATGTGTYTIKEADIGQGKEVNNTATATAKHKNWYKWFDETLTKTANATVKYEKPVEPGIRGIELTKTANPTTYTHAGQKITYTFEVKNTGEVALNGFWFSDKMLFLEEPFGINVWLDSPLEAGKTELLYTHEYTITADDMKKSSIINTAYVSNGTGHENVFDYAEATITKHTPNPEPTDPIGEIIVTKRDSRTNALLPGAMFRLYAPKSVGEGGYGPNMDSFLTGTTGPSGQLIFKVNGLEYDKELFYDKTFVSFFLQEITAPSGYTGSNAIQEVEMAKVCLDEQVPVTAAEQAPALEPAPTPEVVNVEVVSSEVLSEEVIVTEDQKSEEPIADNQEGQESEDQDNQEQEQPPVEQPPVVEEPPVEKPPVEQPKAPQSLAVTTENGEHDCYEYLLKSVELTIYNTPIDTPTPPGGGGGGGATPQSPVRPDPDRPVTVPDEPTPLAPPAEVAVEEVMVPLAEPEVQGIIADEVVADEVIADEVVALAAVPQTGIGYTDYSNVISTNYIITVDAILTDKKRK